MLRKAHQLFGFAIEATDGEIGHVNDFYFDDERWQIRYLVVDTGPWIFGRKVLLTPSVLGQPRWEEKRLPVQLTKAQVENSPETDFDKPVSRQHEIDIHTHYGWSPYWLPFPAPIGVAGIGPVGAPTRSAVGIGERRSSDADLYRDEIQADLAKAEEEGDPHLRSLKEVSGYSIQAQDGQIGHAEDFFIDESNWSIRYLLINTQNWWTGKHVLIAPEWIDSISWPESKVVVGVTRDQVKNSPEYNPDHAIHRDYETALYGYYGIPGYWM